jgi:hypothetical protein
LLAGRLRPEGLTALYLRLRSGQATLRRLVGKAVMIADAFRAALSGTGGGMQACIPWVDARVKRGRR